MEAVKKTTITVKEAANILGCSLAAMYSVTKQADFDALIQLGRRKIILTHKFMQWMERQTSRPSGDPQSENN